MIGYQTCTSHWVNIAVVSVDVCTHIYADRTLFTVTNWYLEDVKPYN